uniref:Heterogeneous nuclear ribonucleoprotein A/B n=1 Tax=Anthurium amnicola TaxID=1678845 RepID=A0A1D1XZW0_9ARAE
MAKKRKLEVTPEAGIERQGEADSFKERAPEGEIPAASDHAVAADGDGVGDAGHEAIAAAGDGGGDAGPEAVAPAVNGDGGVVPEAVAVADEGDGGVAPEAVATAMDGDVDAAAEAVAAAMDGVEDAAPGDVATADGDDYEPEPIQMLLEPLSKEHLINLLCEAAERHADVMEQIHRIADEDPVHRKIFVHGLGWDTKVETLTSLFCQYGEIEDCNVVCDKISGKSKGYGFILFKHRSGARQALKLPQKKIGNRMTACQMASAGPVPPPAPAVSEYTQRKIFVSNVSAELDPHKLLQFFSKYGEIEEGPLGLDKHTGKPKGFALFVYRTADGARKALEEPHKNYEGHILHCQKAIDGPKPNKSGFHPHHSGASLHHGLRHGHFTRGETASFGIGSHVPPAGPGHLMAPSGPGLGFNQGTAPGAAAVAGLNPALGQALASLLTTQGAGLGLTNLIGSLGATGMGGPGPNQGLPATVVNSGAHGMQGTYGNQPAGVAGTVNPGLLGAYGGQSPMHGGYGNAPMAQGSSRGHKGGVAPYMGH